MVNWFLPLALEPPTERNSDDLQAVRTTEQGVDQRDTNPDWIGSNLGRLSVGSKSMKKIPESYELTEEDIKEAIAYWLNNEHLDNEYENNFTIEFKSEQKESYPKGGPRGGMSDPVITTVVTAVAVKDE
jgi:hypothetical protein